MPPFTHPTSALGRAPIAGIAAVLLLGTAGCGAARIAPAATSHAGCPSALDQGKIADPPKRRMVAGTPVSVTVCGYHGRGDDVLASTRVISDRVSVRGLVHALNHLPLPLALENPGGPPVGPGHPPIAQPAPAPRRHAAARVCPASTYKPHPIVVYIAHPHGRPSGVAIDFGEPLCDVTIQNFAPSGIGGLTRTVAHYLRIPLS